ncbi:pectinesterase family protein [Sphingomonas sp. HF-S4]|uniref:Pectinesterase family protein n=1 Tax=Sphingomonas agrestis TaxID=3080540 RepID=A0ABU3Y2T8_9SPHN|nr:pectinesterase family protein [Sphingomonas sp. HF-S4]MDV3455591.1 pectinesterase family protein [Sphingomonas sp. HF-S4]
MDRRTVLGGALLLPAAARAEARWDAIVDPRTGTLGKALERAAAAGGRPFRILVREGVLVEKLTIAVPNVTIVGSGPKTVLSFGTYAGLKHPDGNVWGTGRTGTLTVSAPGTTLRNLTIRNSFDYIGAQRDTAGNGAQAVALTIGREADRTWVDRCWLEGYQDTLYVQSRSLFTDCRIVGGVDFIFGGAAAWFERCEIVTRFVPGAAEFGFLTAPSTPLEQPFGLVFSRCRLGREPGVPARSTWLGRPWRAGGNMALTGQSVFLRCWLDAHIKREGWTWMGYKGPDGEQRRLTPQEARLFEYASRGPGAGPASSTRRMLGQADAAKFTRATVLGGWDGFSG